MCAEALWALPASAVIAIVHQLGLASNHWIERTFSKASSAAAITGLWCTVSVRTSKRIAMVLLVRGQILSNGIAHSA
jgi:hypothetical protein